MTGKLYFLKKQTVFLSDLVYLHQCFLSFNTTRMTRFLKTISKSKFGKVGMEEQSAMIYMYEIS